MVRTLKKEGKRTQAKSASLSMGYAFPECISQLQTSTTKQYYFPEPTPLISDQIVTIKNFLTKDMCNELIGSFKNSKELCLETTPLIKSKQYASRYNDRASTTNAEVAQFLWLYLRDLLLNGNGYEKDASLISSFEDAVGLNSQLRIYRYRKGHYFGRHFDESVTVTTGQTRWTLLIYLTGDEEFKGGATIFYPLPSESRKPKPLSIKPSKGLALLHKHGPDCLQHEAELVTEGEKWVLRSDIVFPF